jgi:uncharacterized surface protein with fasciclin (FAS1) repeats
MKTFKCILLFTALAGTLLATAAPKDQTGSGRDIIDTAMSVHQFDTFLMLVRDADLIFNLKGSGPYTIFAPTDAAFEKMPGDLLDRIHGNKSRLRQFVLHHVVRGSWTAEQAVRMHSLIALDGSRLVTVNVGGRGMIGRAGFTIANIRTSNGTLHGINTVMIPN